MSTHIDASPGAIARHVLLPGDPRRAEWIATTFLDGVSQYSTTRNMFGFTGTYQGVPVSVQGSGMGMPSASIYVHELVNDYGVRSLIRVGTCGALVESMRLGEVIAVNGASTDSAMNRIRFGGLVDYAPVADFTLLRLAVDRAAERQIPLRVGSVLSSDAFYTDRPEIMRTVAEYGTLAVEMECAAIFTIAARHGARALALLTVSDHIPSGAHLSSHDRESTLRSMVEIALDTVVRST